MPKQIRVEYWIGDQNYLLIVAEAALPKTLQQILARLEACPKSEKTGYDFCRIGSEAKDLLIEITWLPDLRLFEVEIEDSRYNQYMIHGMDSSLINRLIDCLRYPTSIPEGMKAEISDWD